MRPLTLALRQLLGELLDRALLLDGPLAQRLHHVAENAQVGIRQHLHNSQQKL